MNYVALASSADRLLKSVGMSVKVFRGTTQVGSGSAVIVKGKTANSTASPSALLASTAVTTKSILLSGLAKEPLVGDTIQADKVVYTIMSIDKVRPTTTTLLYKIEAM